MGYFLLFIIIIIIFSNYSVLAQLGFSLAWIGWAVTINFRAMLVVGVLQVTNKSIVSKVEVTFGYEEILAGALVKEEVMLSAEGTELFIFSSFRRSFLSTGRK